MSIRRTCGGTKAHLRLRGPESLSIKEFHRPRLLQNAGQSLLYAVLRLAIEVPIAGIKSSVSLTIYKTL